jgi:hypothetical protein
MKNSTPEILRLARIEAWREKRFKQALGAGDTKRGLRAAELFTAVSGRIDQVVLTNVKPYRDTV